MWSIFILSANGSGFFNYQTPLSFTTILALAVYVGPCLSAFIVSYLSGTLRPLIQSIFNWRVHLFWYVFALLIIPIIMFLAILVLPGSTESFNSTDFWKNLKSYPVFFIYPAMLIGGPLGEEIGWRGFALPHMEKFFGPLLGSLWLGLLWAFWHAPIWFSHQWTNPTLPNIAIFIFWITSISIIMTWVYNHTRSTFLAILLHTSMDTFPNVILWSMFPITGTMTSFGVLYAYIGFALGFGLTALLLIILTNAQLGYQKK